MPKTVVSDKQTPGCIVLVGMPGAGKSTVGRCLASRLDWAFMDSDALIESLYGRCLQDITDHFGKAGFLAVESTIVQSIRVSRCIIATGGSVVYSREAVAHLAALGPIVYLRAPLPVLMERIALNPQRGIAIAPGQTMEDLFKEREKLYTACADWTCDVTLCKPEECAAWIIDNVAVSQVVRASD